MAFGVGSEDEVGYSDQAELDPGDLRILANGLIATGVFTGCQVTQQGTADGTVAVSSGTYWIDAAVNFAIKSQAGGNVSVLTGAANPDGTTALAADATYWRYDLVVVNTSGQLGVLHGTPPSPTWPSYIINPKFPAVNLTTHCVLAALFIPPTSASIVGISTPQIAAKDLTLKLLGLPLGLTGTDAAARFVGGRVAGAPTTGTFVQNDFVVDRTGKIFVCTVSGTPGTWVQVGSTVTTIIGTDTFWGAKGQLAVASANDTAVLLDPPTVRQQVLGADEVGNVAWVSRSSSPKGVPDWDEMLYNSAITVSNTPLGKMVVNLTGTGATTATISGSPVDGNHPGVTTFATGTTTTGRCSLGGTSGSLVLGGGRYRTGAWVYLPNASVVGDRFEVVFGFADGFSNATIVDGCFFTYRDDISANWTVTTVANSVSTATNQISTGVACNATTWYFLEVEVNAAGTSVSYFINNSTTPVVTHTTNIPTGQARATGWQLSILKSLGTTSRSLAVDAYYLDFDFTTAR